MPPPMTTTSQRVSVVSGAWCRRAERMTCEDQHGTVPLESICDLGVDAAFHRNPRAPDALALRCGRGGFAVVTACGAATAWGANVTAIAAPAHGSAPADGKPARSRDEGEVAVEVLDDLVVTAGVEVEEQGAAVAFEPQRELFAAHL